MSYDFAVLTPEAAGAGDHETVARAVAVFEQEEPAPEPDPRLRDFLLALEEAGAADESEGWVSVWPLDIGEGGVGVPTSLSDVDDHLVTLLRLAAPHGLVVVDLDEDVVHAPAPGESVGVTAGDGTRLGALTRGRLDSLLDGLPAEDPWLVLERDAHLYLQTYRNEDGTFLLEHRDGSPERHFSTSLADGSSVGSRMWGWIVGDPAWNADLAWERVTF